MKGVLCLIAATFLVELSSTFASASEKSSVSPDPVARREELHRQFEILDRQISPQMKLLFEERGRGRYLSLGKKERKLRAEYRNLKDQLWFWNHSADLQKELIGIFERVHPESSQETMKTVRREAGLLGYTAIDNTVRLQKEYGIQTFPIIHNLFIDLGLKKRGACKHWAEDLLKSFDAIPHPHFTSYWGEAHPGNILEHNVAVLTPVGGTFEDGILIDPWRTAGKPFWERIRDDSPHWRAWIGYDPNEGFAAKHLR